MTFNKGLVIFGGTFDPVHNGHIQSAVAIRELLGVEAVKLVPCKIPPHRGIPSADAKDRLSMLQIGVKGLAGIEIDDRELCREGTSYTFDTLKSYRQEIGEELPLIFTLGLDAFQTLSKWYRWQELCDLAHLLVLTRPLEDTSANPGQSASPEPAVPSELMAWSCGKNCHEPSRLMEQPAGYVCRLSLVQVAVSATMVRERYSRGEEPRELVPEVVNRYIKARRLYESC